MVSQTLVRQDYAGRTERRCDGRGKVRIAADTSNTVRLIWMRWRTLLLLQLVFPPFIQGEIARLP